MSILFAHHSTVLDREACFVFIHHGGQHSKNKENTEEEACYVLFK